jgi:protease YdgD
MRAADVLALAVACALGACVLLPAASAQVRSEGRVRVDVREAPWRSIGKLQSVGGSLREVCSGVVVAARTVATAAHCLYNVRTERPFAPSSVHFLLGLEGPRFASAVLAESFIIAPGYDPAAVGDTRASDWALVTLAAPMPDQLALPLLPTLPAAGAVVMLGGYGQDNANVLTADTDCRVTGLLADARGGRLLRHDCSTIQGTSGAPLLIRTDRGWAIAGINVALVRATKAGLAITVVQMARRL